MTPTFSQCARRISYRESRVRGGAMLGLILGVIIGLAVALGVAIYVAKVPIPFVSNMPVHNDEQGAVEDQRNRGWNPNTALQAHGPAQPASEAGSAPQQQQQRQPTTVPPPAEVGQPAAPNQPAASVAAQPQPHGPAQAEGTEADVLGDFAAAHARAADDRNNNNNNNPSAGAAADAPFVYFVQTGAFRTVQDADAERARLSLLGMEAAITEYDQAGRQVYRVRVGPFQNRAAADQIKDRLADNGFEAALARVPR
jgi:cell division protein FtsN